MVIINSEKLKKFFRKYIFESDKPEDIYLLDDIESLLTKIGINTTDGIVLTNPRLYLHNDAFYYELKFSCSSIDDKDKIPVTIMGYITPLEITVKQGNIISKYNVADKEIELVVSKCAEIDNENQNELSVNYPNDCSKIIIRYKSFGEKLLEIVIYKSSNNKDRINISEVIDLAKLYEELSREEFFPTVDSFLRAIDKYCVYSNLFGLNIRLVELIRACGFYSFDRLDLKNGVPIKVEYKYDDQFTKYFNGTWEYFDKGLRVSINDDYEDSKRLAFESSFKNGSSDIENIPAKMDTAIDQIKRSRTRLYNTIKKYR